MGGAEEADRTQAVEPELARTVAAAATPAVEAVAELPRGTAVGRYVVLSRLGEGAMGVVYAAYDPELDRKVALKLVRAGADAGHEATTGRTRLLREAQALARLSHPNVVAIHDVGTFRDQVWLAMEHVDGRTLKAWSKESPRSWREVLPVMTAVGQGLAAAHAAGLVHRDLKPDNIMIGADGRVRVMDFGLARTAEQPPAPASPLVAPTESALSVSVTQAGSLMGTPAYMAPELIQGHEADARSDQFSFCVTLWETLYRERPFGAGTLIDLTLAVLGGRLRPPPRGVEVPGWLRRVATRGLEVEPSRRFASMTDLLAELARGQSRGRTGRALLAVAAAGTLAAAAALWQRHEHAGRLAACTAAGAEIADVWDAAAAERLRNGLIATGVAQAATTFDKLVPWIDRRAAAWAEQREQVCREGTIDRTLTPDLHARAVACLDERRDEFAALLAVLGEGDRAAVQRAVTAVAGLAPLSACRDRAALERRAAPADDPAVHARSVELRRDLTRANGLGLTGRAADGLARAEAALAAAEALGDPSLIVDARVVVGGLALRTGKLEQAERALAQAYLDGGAMGSDEAAASAAVYLIEIVGVQGARIAEGLQWARSAELHVRRMGQWDGLRGVGVLNNLANLHAVRGATDESLAVGERVLELRRRELGEDHPLVAASLINLGETHRQAGDLEQALTLQQRGLEIAEQTLGPEHPNVATALNNLGGVQIQRGELELGRAALARALAIREQVLGPDHPEVATTLHNLGEIARRRGDLDDARALVERAVAIQEKKFGADHPAVARSVLVLATIAEDRRDLDAARDLGEQALARFVRAAGPDHPDVADAAVALARLQAARGEHDAARALFEQAARVLEQTPEPRLGLAEPLRGLAELALTRGRPADAVPLLERALALHAGQPSSAARGHLRFALARALATTGEATRARALASDAADDLRSAGETAALAEVEAWSRGAR